jgi:hypothetical protein
MRVRIVLPVRGKKAITNPTQPPAGPTAPRRRPVDRVGLASFLLGGLALPAASLPGLHLLAAALALVGGGLAVLGLVRGWRKQVLFSALGLGSCLPALLIAAWPGSQPSRPANSTDPDAPRMVRLRDSSPEEVNATSAATWVNASREAAQQGGVRVRVLGAVVAAVPLTDSGGQQRLSPDRSLILRLRLSNMAADRPVRYVSWSAPATADVPLLEDQLGRAYPLRTFGPGLGVSGQVSQASLIPGKWTDDVLVFAPPGPDSVLHLTLPASAFGGKGLLRLEIPAQMIVFR